MAKEYIEREAAKRELLSWAVCMNHPEYLMKDDALHVIDSIPAADVAPVRHVHKAYSGRPIIELVRKSRMAANEPCNNQISLSDLKGSND